MSIYNPDKLIKRIRELWSKERVRGALNPASELGLCLEDLDEDRLIALGQRIKARIAELPRKGEHLLPDGARLEQCRSCGASISWARTANGKAVPLSLKTVEHRHGERWALSHFVDCPEAKDWSRR